MRNASSVRVLIALAAAVGAALPACAAPGPDAEALLRTHDCTFCHARDETRTGPSWVDVAARYRGDPSAAARLTAVVRKGAHGAGPWHMPPLPQVPESDARAMVEHILSSAK